MKCNICELADLESTAQTPGGSQDANSERLGGAQKKEKEKKKDLSKHLVI